MMRGRSVWRVAYGAVLSVQAVLLLGAYRLHVLSRQRMMLMRYLVAKNRELEAVWFSHGAVRIQAVTLVAIAVASLIGAAFSAIRRSRLLAWQLAIGAVLSAVGAWLLLSFSAEKVWSLYALILAVWVAVLLQAIVVGVSLVRARG